MTATESTQENQVTLSESTTDNPPRLLIIDCNLAGKQPSQESVSNIITQNPDEYDAIVICAQEESTTKSKGLAAAVKQKLSDKTFHTKRETLKTVGLGQVSLTIFSNYNLSATIFTTHRSDDFKKAPAKGGIIAHTEINGYPVMLGTQHAHAHSASFRAADHAKRVAIAHKMDHARFVTYDEIPTAPVIFAGDENERNILPKDNDPSPVNPASTSNLTNSLSNSIDSEPTDTPATPSDSSSPVSQGELKRSASMTSTYRKRTGSAQALIAETTPNNDDSDDHPGAQRVLISGFHIPNGTGNTYKGKGNKQHSPNQDTSETKDPKGKTTGGKECAEGGELDIFLTMGIDQKNIDAKCYEMRSSDHDAIAATITLSEKKASGFDEKRKAVINMISGLKFALDNPKKFENLLMELSVLTESEDNQKLLAFIFNYFYRVKQLAEESEIYRLKDNAVNKDNGKKDPADSKHSSDTPTSEDINSRKTNATHTAMIKLVNELTNDGCDFFITKMNEANTTSQGEQQTTTENPILNFATKVNNKIREAKKADTKTKVALGASKALAAIGGILAAAAIFSNPFTGCVMLAGVLTGVAVLALGGAAIRTNKQHRLLNSIKSLGSHSFFKPSESTDKRAGNATKLQPTSN